MRYSILFFLICSCFLFSENSKASDYKKLSENYEKIIVIDAGHGGSDEGAKVSSLKEKNLALLSALLIKKHLNELGYKVVLTRGKDAYLPLYKRATIANRIPATVFISVHFNAFINEEIKGVEIFFHAGDDMQKRKESYKLGENVMRGILCFTKAASRGVKSAELYVLRETKMPSILVEGGFMTNEMERKKLKEHDYLDMIAKGVAEGVQKYFANKK